MLETIQPHILSQVSHLLASSLELNATLLQAAELIVPEVADWCILDIVEEGEEIRRLMVKAREDADQDLVRRIRTASSAHEMDFGMVHVLRTGQPLIRLHIDFEEAKALLNDKEKFSILHEMEAISGLILPLCARGKIIGTLTLVRTSRSGICYTEQDAKLALELSQRTALAIDNAILYHQATEAAHAREEFLSVASHELRTPVSSLQLQLRVLQTMIRSRSPRAEELMPTLVEQANRQCSQLHKLINQLLDFSRIRAKRLELNTEILELGELLHELARRLERNLVEAGCVLTIKTNEKVIGLWDRLRIEQVITNLLSNAMKYGSGKPIEVVISRSANFAEIAVIDQGIGISEQNLKRIFRRFERINTDRAVQGFGLGLYIVQEIVEAHGGKIRVMSSPNEGSTFVVRLPIKMGLPTAAL